MYLRLFMGFCQLFSMWDGVKMCGCVLCTFPNYKKGQKFFYLCHFVRSLNTGRILKPDKLMEIFTNIFQLPYLFGRKYFLKEHVLTALQNDDK